jgi:superfamily II DNA or RNA helicase
VLIDQDISHKLVYSLYNHEYLGLLLAPYIVQLNQRGDFTYTHKKLNQLTAKEFDYLMDDDDRELIKLLDECDQQYIIRKHSPKKGLRPVEFFQKYYANGMHEHIRPITEQRLAKALQLLRNKAAFIMGDDDDPTWKPIVYNEGKVSVLFHLKRDENGIRYYPTLLHKGKLLKFQQQQTMLISNQPVWMLIDNQLYEFDPEMEGVKLQPFFTKYFIQVPKSSEDAYMRKFAFHLIERYQVKAEGFEIVNNRAEAVPALRLCQLLGEQLSLVLLFRYDDQEIIANNTNRVLVRMEHSRTGYKFIRTVRSHIWELNQHEKLNRLGLHCYTGAAFQLEDNSGGDYALIEWLAANRPRLEEAGFEIEQDELSAHYYIQGSSLDMEILETGDWFDIQAKIKFGEYEIPFLRLRQHIIAGIREYELPNGKIAIIPESWFSKLKSVFSQVDAAAANQLRMHRHHYQTVSELQQLLMSRAEEGFRLKISALTDFSTIDEILPSPNFKASLRNYQQAGLNWLWFLRQHGFGGILADDMGLGKTVQTISLLQKDKDEKQNHAPSLLIVPTSILHNWYSEAKKFAPEISVMIHAGTQRDRTEQWFYSYDLVVTSYGTARVDLEMLKRVRFNYIILDEGQNIKNPASQISRAVRLLHAQHRLVLSGTPVENSVIDLWSIMSFVNPGLLGSLKQFRQQFANPIEKEKDEQTADRLRKLIHPFVLRRTKKQVAKDLPDRIEQIHYCDMTDSQEAAYEKTKAGFRNEILEAIEKQGLVRSQMLLLRGLTVLRQLANHPGMVDAQYTDSSGKFEEVMRMLKNALHEGHKILVFSQFVKHLRLVKKRLDVDGIRYSYLDGQTPRDQRKTLVNEFNSDNQLKVFLISLKAGGLGLNLTSADYVVLLDPWWNPAVEQQAIDRSHRIGQTRKVISYRFITKNSVEEKILALQEKKRSISDSLVSADHSFVKSLQIEDIKAILS